MVGGLQGGGDTGGAADGGGAAGEGGEKRAGKPARTEHYLQHESAARGEGEGGANCICHTSGGDRRQGEEEHAIAV